MFWLQCNGQGGDKKHEHVGERDKRPGFGERSEKSELHSKCKGKSQEGVTWRRSIIQFDFPPTFILVGLLRLMAGCESRQEICAVTQLRGGAAVSNGSFSEAGWEMRISVPWFIWEATRGRVAWV